MVSFVEPLERPHFPSYSSLARHACCLLIERLERTPDWIRGIEPFDGAQGRLIEQLERASVFDSANHVQINVHETTVRCSSAWIAVA
jgi:hypothetical protein